MGGRKKQKKAHNNYSRAGTTSSQYNNPVELTKEEEASLTAECLQIHMLLETNMKDTRSEKACYLLSKRWLEAWKTYVGYDHLTKGNPDSKMPKAFGKRAPGPINENMQKTVKDYYQVPKQMDSYQYLNIVINDKLDKGDDYLPAGSKLWQAFADKYDVGQEILRPIRQTKSSFFYDAELLHCDVMFVDHQELDSRLLKKDKLSKKEKDDFLDLQKMQFSTIWQLTDLYKFMGEYVKHVFKSEKEIKIWKVYNYLSFKELQSDLVQNVEEQTYKLGAVPLEGSKYDELDIDEFLRQYYTLVVEVNGLKFKQEPAPEEPRGYCQECLKVKNLVYSCPCGEVKYCSMECRIDDQAFHFNSCETAFESDDDEEYSNKKVKLGHNFMTSGLQNLGNTCYMNSSLQFILSMDEFRDFYSNNEYLEHESQADKKQLFLKKFSKFCKQVCESKQPFEPWSLKGQVSHQLSAFKGYKQHDADDFITNFINLTNEFLSKGEDAFHSIIKDNLIGQFDSLITCPDQQCRFQIKNIETFMQITLPIKQKAKRTFYNYVIMRKNGITKGRAEKQDSWKEIRTNLGVANKTAPIYSTREGDPLYYVNEENTTEKQLKGLKGKQIIIYPQIVVNEGESQFSFLQISTKKIGGMDAKSHIGYPYLIKIDSRATTMIGFWIEIAKTFEHIYVAEQLAGLEKQYLNWQKSKALKMQMREASTKQESRMQSNENMEATEDQTQEEESEDQTPNKILQAMKATLSLAEIRVYLQDAHRSRNICSFCKKRCGNCPLPVVLDQSVEDFLGDKLDEVRFEIHLKNRIDPEIQQVNLANSGDSTLEDCFQLFKFPEQLDQENAWWCAGCDQLRLAYKQLTIHSLPKLLIIQLSRFKADGDRKVKSSQPIQYGQVQRFEGIDYKLLAVVIHEGSMQAGHYWAICLRGDQYYIYNDEKVVPTDKIWNKNAYILLYRRVEQ